MIIRYIKVFICVLYVNSVYLVLEEKKSIRLRMDNTTNKSFRMRDEFTNNFPICVEVLAYTSGYLPNSMYLNCDCDRNEHFYNKSFRIPSFISLFKTATILMIYSWLNKSIF